MINGLIVDTCLISLERPYVVAALGNDLFHNLNLGSHGIHGDDVTLKIEHF